MIIEIAGGGYPVHGWWFILIPVAILALGVVSAIFWDDEEIVLVKLGIILTAVYAILFGVFYAPVEGVLARDHQKAEALEGRGFENVELENDSFTASQDGEYFSGSLLEIAENTFQVVEKVEVK